MKTKFAKYGCTALVLLTVAVTGNQLAQAQSSNVFNPVLYQGSLTADFGPGWDDSPHLWDFLFRAVIPPYPCSDIIDCPWRTNCPNCTTIELGTNSVIVNKGLFATPINMPTGILRSASGVYLQVVVRTNGGGAFTTLSPMPRNFLQISCDLRRWILL